LADLKRKPTIVGGERPHDDYEILDEQQKSIGRIMLHPQAPPDNHWFWTITARFPQTPHDRGYAESGEQAMADFKMAWRRNPVRLHES
jgi:hypothetical protein